MKETRIKDPLGGNLRRSSDIDDWAVRDEVGDGLMIE